MTLPEERAVAKEIALGLARALERALASGAPASAIGEARDAVQVLSLPGLDRLLEVLVPHAGRPWPAELSPVIERVRRVAAESASEGDVAAFRRADADLAALAAEAESITWSAPPGEDAGETAVATVDAADALAELPIEGASPRGVRLTPRVAAALRAAVDWLVGEGGPRRPLRVAAEDSVLEVTCESVHPGGLKPAHEVISAVGGSLGPPSGAGEGPHPPGSCRVRVPAFSARSLYLLVVQGGVRLAVPWHAVLRVHVLAAAELESRERGIGGTMVLPEIAPSSEPLDERPVVLIAHGIKRGYLVADRLVWRMPAETVEEPGAPPAPGLERAVRAEEGEIYWVADPAKLLAVVPLPPLPEPRSSRRASPPAEDAPRPRMPEPRAKPPEPLRLEDADVEALPLEFEDLPREAAPTPPAGPQALSSVTEAPPAPPKRVVSEASVRAEAPQPAVPKLRVLVAEDSLTARIFLTRMLEQHGFEVTAVARASELSARLDAGPWALLFVDTELPDASGPEALKAASRASAPLVALVRDRHDVEVASAAGVSRVLRKPFDPDELDALLTRLDPRSGKRP